MEGILEKIKAIADETRFKIINLLIESDICVGALAQRLGLSQAAISQHLQILRKAGLVKGEKRGYWTHYTVEKDVFEQLVASLARMLDEPVFKSECCLSEKNIKECCRKEGEGHV